LETFRSSSLAFFNVYHCIDFFAFRRAQIWRCNLRLWELLGTSFLSKNIGMMAVGNPPVNALNGLSLKSLMSVAEPVRTMGTPCAGGAAPFF
jgi:hypothetical protein